jgi:hypothetical protein
MADKKDDALTLCLLLIFPPMGLRHFRHMRTGCFRC